MNQGMKIQQGPMKRKVVSWESSGDGSLKAIERAQEENGWMCLGRGNRRDFIGGLRMCGDGRRKYWDRTGSGAFQRVK